MSNKMKLHFFKLLIVLVVVLASGCADNKHPNVELTISAAASLSDVLAHIKTQFESENEHIRLNFNFGASGVLQHEIEQGAPVDIFLSAASKNMRNSLISN